MSEQQRYVDVISKRQKRKQETIILGITFFIVFIFTGVLSENNNTGFIFSMTLLMLLVSLIWFVTLITKNIIDRIKNGSDKFLYFKLNEDGRELLRLQENKEKTNNIINEVKTKSNKTLLIIGFIILFGIIGSQLDSADYSSTQTATQVQPTKKEAKKEKPKQDLTWFAEYACKKAIEAHAVYPPSVKVHFRSDNYIKGNSYTIYGTVDSQNAIGAMVRQNFACEAIIDEANDKYWIKDLNIE